jgi:hypothetical protein
MFAGEIPCKNLRTELGEGFVVTPFDVEGAEKVDNKGALWVMSIGGKEGGTETVQIEDVGKLEHVRASWVKGGFKPRCLAASSAPPPQHLMHCPAA